MIQQWLLKNKCHLVFNEAELILGLGGPLTSPLQIWQCQAFDLHTKQRGALYRDFILSL